MASLYTRRHSLGPRPVTWASYFLAWSPTVSLGKDDWSAATAPIASGRFSPWRHRRDPPAAIRDHPASPCLFRRPRDHTCDLRCGKPVLQVCWGGVPCWQAVCIKAWDGVSEIVSGVSKPRELLRVPFPSMPAAIEAKLWRPKCQRL